MSHPRTDDDGPRTGTRHRPHDRSVSARYWGQGVGGGLATAVMDEAAPGDWGAEEPLGPAGLSGQVKPSAPMPVQNATDWACGSSEVPG